MFTEIRDYHVHIKLHYSPYLLYYLLNVLLYNFFFKVCAIYLVLIKATKSGHNHHFILAP